jgi:hypothetical protein
MGSAIVKALLYILNPLNWPAIGAIISAIVSFVKTILDGIEKRKQQKTVDDLQGALDDVSKGNTLEEKAKAGCRAEKILNPNSDCDRNDG